MPGLVPYVLAGGIVVLAMNATMPLGAGLPGAFWPSVDAGPQVINRADKADRLPLPIAAKPAPAKPLHVLVGCEPAFSPLSAAAQLNFPGRCLA